MGNISDAELLAMSNSLSAVRALMEISSDKKAAPKDRIKAASTLCKIAHEAYLETEENQDEKLPRPQEL